LLHYYQFVLDHGIPHRAFLFAVECGPLAAIAAISATVIHTVGLKFTRWDFDFFDAFYDSLAVNLSRKVLAFDRIFDWPLSPFFQRKLYELRGGFGFSDTGLSGRTALS